MQIAISGHNLEITDALRARITDKIGKLAARHFDRMPSTQVVLQVEKTRHMAEATINAKGATLHASSTADNMYAAIDALTQKLNRQIIRHKQKSTARMRKLDADLHAS